MKPRARISLLVSLGMAAGAFILIDRQAYQRIGGHD